MYRIDSPLLALCCSVGMVGQSHGQSGWQLHLYLHRPIGIVSPELRFPVESGKQGKCVWLGVVHSM